MGKQGRGNKQQQWQRDASAGRWQSGWQRDWNTDPGYGSSLSGMRYDQMQAPSNKTGTGHGDEAATTGNLSMVQVVQKAVNTSRRANAKVKRLEQEIVTKGEQWDAFQKALKQVFRDQFAQYESDQQRLEKDLSEASDHPCGGRMGVKEEPTGDPWDDFMRQE